MVTSTIDTQEHEGAQARKATQPLELARFRMEAQRGIDMAAALVREGSEQAHALAQRLLEAVMLVLRALLRVLARVLRDFKAGFSAGYETQAPGAGQAPAEGASERSGAEDAPGEGAGAPLEPEAVARSVDEQLPTEVTAQDPATAARARRVVELTANWAADHLAEVTQAAAHGEFHTWSPAIAAAMKALASDMPVLDQATKARDDAHAALHAAALTVATRVGAEKQVPLFADALARITLEKGNDNANGRHLLPRMIDVGGEFEMALRNYRDAVAAHRIALDRVQALIDCAAPIGSSDRPGLDRAVDDAYPGLLTTHEIETDPPSTREGSSRGIHEIRPPGSEKASQDAVNESRLRATSILCADDVPYERLIDDEVMSDNVHRLESTRPNPFAVLYKGPSKQQPAEAMAATG